MNAPVRAVALVLAWSSGFIGAELGARAAPPATVLTWRFLVTAVVLLPWLLRAARRLDRAEWRRQAVLALLCQCLYLAGVFWAAAAGVPAGTSALIASLQPALVFTAAVLLGTQRRSRGHVVGLVLGSAGVALTAVGDLRAGVGSAALVLPVAAMLALTAGTLLQQRWSAPPRREVPLLQTLAVQAVVSAIFSTAVTAAAGQLTPPPTPQFWTATTWSVLAGVASYGLYYLATTRDGAVRASTVLYVTPAVTALWAALVFGQPLRPATVVGLLVSGVAVVVMTTASSPPLAVRCPSARTSAGRGPRRDRLQRPRTVGNVLVRGPRTATATGGPPALPGAATRGAVDAPRAAAAGPRGQEREEPGAPRRAGR